MRKYLFAALVALCIAVPGTVTATPLYSGEIAQSGEMAPQFVEDILRAGADQSEWSFEELTGMYYSGLLFIEKVGSEYRISDQKDGGILIVIIEDML